MLTLNQIITQIQVLANAHAQIESNGVGDIHEWQAKPDRVYPVLWIFHERTDISDQYFTYRIRLLSADRVKTGEEGDDTDGHEQEVLSDRQSVLLDFIAYFAQQHGQDYIVERIGSIEPFTERMDDRVAGCSYLLNIKQPWDFAKCSIPQSGAVIPPTVDGLTLYDFCDQSVIDRLTPTQVACLEAQYGGSCDPATITINGAAYGSVPSGGTEDIPVINGGSNPVGSLQGSDWVIGNSAIDINGTQVGDVVAEDTLSIAVELDGNPAGSWNPGTQTWEVTSSSALTCTITPSTTTPGLFELITLTCDQAGRATYKWRVTADDAGLKIQNAFSFSGQSIQFRPIYDGTWTVELTVTDGSGGVGRATVTLTVANGVRYCEMTTFVPTGGGSFTFETQANLSPIKIPNVLGNNANAYHTNPLLGGTQGGILWMSNEYTCFSRWGLSLTFNTYTGSAQQQLDPDWKWQVGGYASNNTLGRRDNGTNVTFSPSRSTGQNYWFRLDREAGGTVKLYVLDEINAGALERYITNQIGWTLLHTFSQTSVADLYIRMYTQAIQGQCKLYMYGDA